MNSKTKGTLLYLSMLGVALATASSVGAIPGVPENVSVAVLGISSFLWKIVDAVQHYLEAQALSQANSSNQPTVT